MTCKLPITLEDFKNYFGKDRGFEFQPYPSWVKTVFDNGDFCLFDNAFYKSLKDLNIVKPDESLEEDPSWEILTLKYEEGTTYNVGDIVYYEGVFYTPLEQTEENPLNVSFWAVVTEETLQEKYNGYRVWAKPKAYNVGDKVIARKNYRLGVYLSEKEENYYDPANSLFSKEPIDQYAWVLQEDETIDWILDEDIERAMGEACFKFNARLVPNEEKRKIIALYLTAFFVAYDRQMSNAGLNSGSSSGPVKSRTVGKMSVSYMESKLFERHPSYEFFARNQYGIKAFNLLLPYLRGNVLVLNGRVSAE